MNPRSSPLPEDLQVPLPKGQFRWFMIFFHVVLIAGLSLSLGASCWQAREDLGWRQVALATLANELGSRAKLAIDLRVPSEADRLPPAVAEALWRVAQEALTNVEKHASARQAVVTLAWEPKRIVMRVTDDGVGLPADAERRPGHYGLRGLRERVEGLGGTLSLSGASNQGTVIEARLSVC